MSKPKPGLGKGIARTLAHSPVSASTSALQGYIPGVSNAIHSSSSSSGSGYVAYSTSNISIPVRREGFASLGLPTGSSTSWPLSSSPPHSLGGLDNGDVVTTYRGSRYNGRSSEGKRRLSTQVAPAYTYTPANDIAGLINWLKPTYKVLEPAPTGLEIDLITPLFHPSPSAPSPRRPAEVQLALSPTSQATSGESIGAGSALFGVSSLGIPSTALDALHAVPESEGTALNIYSSNLIFHLGASGSAKERPTFTPTSRRSSSPTPPPRPRSFPLPDIDAPENADLRSVGVGEDAYFARMDGLCIADGVGGWARSGRGGADAGRWSRLLTHFCEVEVGDWWAGKAPYARDGEVDGGIKEKMASSWAKKVWRDAKDTGSAERQSTEEKKRRPLDPVEIMQRGFEKCLSCFTSEGIHGSSTCILALLHHSTLSIANLGDCCLLLIRDGEVIFRTDEMQHAFNFPLQLGTHSRDEPMKDAKRYDVGVSKGDVVVLGSDGLMDNLFDEDILETLSQFSTPTSTRPASPSFPPRSDSPSSTPPHFSPQSVSEALCRRARAVSEQTSATTPFMVKAIEEGIDFVGGKKDDISVLVGVIGDREPGQGLSGLALHT